MVVNCQEFFFNSSPDTHKHGTNSCFGASVTLEYISPMALTVFCFLVNVYEQQNSLFWQQLKKKNGAAVKFIENPQKQNTEQTRCLNY